ncbi:glutamate receptor ionotropic, kainate glr-3-like [Anabrus simplex]|uniref:glutamate receptor ionotropic, kainate glr-3-like n=1 Tax=Anabrus simplex TaxID=316456 RepID=UPI0035A2DC4D
MTKHSYMNLVQLIAPAIPQRNTNMREYVSAVERVLITLRILAYLREPRFDDFNWESFLAPLSSSLWQATGVCTFVLAATLAGIYYFSWRNGDESAQGVYSFAFRDSLFYMFTSLTQQGHDVTPRSSSGRVVYLLGYVVAVIVMTAYSAALVSFLTAQVKELPFRDLNGLLADGTYKLGVVATAADFNMFSESKNSLMQQLYEKLMKPDTQNLAATVEEAASRLCRTKFVLVVSAEFPGNVLQISNCSVASLPDVSFKNIMSLALAPGSPYLGLINHILLNMRNSGILRQMSMKSPFQLQDTKETSLRSVHLENVVPIFTILACGIGIGLLLLAVEMTQNRLFRRLQVTSGTRDRSLFRSSPFRWNLLQRSRQETFLPPNTRGKNQSKGISVQTKKAFEGVEGNGFL